MDTFFQDLRFAFRSMMKRPAFTAIAVLALALGIGANTAIFSVINNVLLKPLPFREPDRLTMVYNTADKEDQLSVTYPDFNDWRAQQQSFEQIGAYSSRDFTLTGVGEPLRLRAAMMTSDVFPLLGEQPVIGRFFTPEEDKPGARVVILSNKVWRDRFSADRDLRDKTITLNGQSYTVVGVMPEGFSFPIQSDPQIELWTTTATLQEGRAPLTVQRGNHALDVVGRLKPGVTIEQAQADLDAIAANLAGQYPETNAEFGVRVASLHTDLVRDIRSTLWILFGAVACVLLIACANVANLLLVRASTRHKEIAIRTAMGASRFRVVRQLLTESLILAVVGGLVGMVLALWATDSLIALVPKGLPRVAEIGLDPGMLGFTLLVSLLTGLLFGIAPALQISKSNLTQTLKEGGRSSTDGAQHNRLRSSLIVAEVAIALMLLVTAGLLINSFYRLQQLKPGFNTENVLSFRLSLPDARYRESQQITDFYKNLTARISTLPGIKNAAYTTALPFSGQRGGVGFSIEGEPQRPNVPFPYEADYRSISPGYFQAMGIRLIQGRDYDERDLTSSTPVVIINETLANRHFPDQNPIGKRINPSFGIDERGILMREIIGVVSDVKHNNLNEAPRNEVYIAHTQNPRPVMTYAVRTTTEPKSAIAAIRGEIQSMDSELPMFNVRTMEEFISTSVAAPRFNTLLLGVFAGVALVLTVVGLYGVMSYSVTLRTHEIGVRMALGAKQSDVLGLVIKQGMKLALLGVGLGLGAAFAVARITETLLFGVTATDPMTFAAVSLLMLGVALVACFVPARRAAKTDPMVALRYE